MQREYKISLSQEYYSDVVYLSQYDDDYDVIFHVINKYSAADVGGKSAKFTGTRTDGLGFTFNAVAVGSSVSFHINTSLTACAGTHTAEIIFYSNDGLYFGSANVQVIVEKAAHPEGTIDADEEALRELAEQVQEIVDTAAAEVKGEAESWAVGERDGEPVPSTDPTYENNAKYYAEQAQDIADSIGIDATLSVAGKAADAKKTGDEISDLKEDLNLIIEESDTVVPLNFNIVGYYYNGNLNNLNTDIADARSCIISVESGEKYKVSGQSQYNQKLACVYDANDNILLTIMPENSGQIITDHEFTIPENGVKMSLSYLHNYPAYAVTLKKIIKSIKPLSAENVDFFAENMPVNLFDYSSAVDGEYFNANGTISSRTDMCCAYVPISSGQYVVHASYNFYGNTANRIPYFDANKQYLGYINGTKLTSGSTNLEVVLIDVPNNAKYIGVSNRVVYKYRVMVVKSSTMPEKYSVYHDEYTALEDAEKVNVENVKGANFNPLYLKTVAFDGDSICHGISANDNKSGWAGRIGNANAMNWKNYGISGGTITDNHSHCILNTLDDIYTYMPTLDYYIYEGGTNDADHLGLAGIGSVTDDDYSGTYDATTFSGAFETLIYKALTYYPTAKIGYIVAQKMGKTNNANYAVRKAFFERAKEICKKWGIPYIDLWGGSHLNPNLISMYDSSLDASGNISANKLYIDGQHLTPTGYDVITPIIEAWMKTL